MIRKTKRHSILEGLRNRKPFRKALRKPCKGKECDKEIKEEEEVEIDDDELLLTGDDVEGEFDDEMLLGESKTERDFTRLVESFMDDDVDGLDDEDTEDKLDDDEEDTELPNVKRIVRPLKRNARLRELPNKSKFGESYRPMRRPHRRLAESHKRPLRHLRPERMVSERREVRKPVLREHRLHRKLRSPFHK